MITGRASRTWLRPRIVTRKRLASQSRTRLVLRSLEDRSVPAALVVNALTDTGAGSGTAGDIRFVMNLANSNLEDDTITFDPALFSTPQIIQLTTGQLTYTENNLLTINGPGAANVTIQGGVTAAATNRIFKFDVTGAAPAISISDVTLAGGNLTSTNNGGAILVADEVLTLTNVVFSGNKTAGAGGAISASAAGANLTVTNGTFTGNAATGAGGAIHLGAAGTVIVSGSTFTANTASTGGAIHGASSTTLDVSNSSFGSHTTTSNGGAMQFAAGASFVTINNSSFTSNKGGGNGGAISGAATTTLNITGSTFTGNTAPAGGVFRLTGTPTLNLKASTVSGNSSSTGVGGGIYFVTGGSLVVDDSTISGNTAATAGGGISMASATATITNSTISGNVANSTTLGGGGISLSTGNLTLNNSTVAFNKASAGTASGGGIRKTSATSGGIVLSSTIVAQNSSATGGPDLHNSTTTTLNVTGDNNLVGVGDLGNIFLTGINQAGTAATPLDPLLAPLGNFGGPTFTHPLFSASPAIDQGNNLLGLSFDQRGSGFTRTLGAQADVGAYEGTLKIPSAKATLTNVTTGGGTTYVATVEYTDETGINVGTIDLNDVTLSGALIGGGSFGPVSPVSFGTSGSGTLVTATYTFNVPGGAWDPADNGTYTLTMVANQVFDTDAGTPNAVGAGPLGTFAVAIPTTFTVDIIDDEDDGNTSPGDLSLREAIKLANGIPNVADVINFAPGLAGKTITLTLGELSITDAVTITGLGSGQLTISGNSASRIFNINIAGTGNAVNISGLTLTGGQVTGSGGAIVMTDDALTLTDVVVSGNTASSAGGGIQFTTGTLNVVNSTISNNTATASTGGAIDFSTGTVTFTRSTASGNFAGSTGGFTDFTSGSLTVVDSTVDNNTTNSTSGGGAINLSTGKVTITNSTFSGNKANSGAAVGGALRGTSSLTLNVNNSTFTGNSASGAGGGAFAFTATGATTQPTVNIASSILAQNLNTNHPELYSAATTVTLTVNVNDSIIGADAGLVIISGSNNQVGFVGSELDAKLAPLNSYGGPTRTHGLLPGSPALNAGSNALALANDQRGAGFPRTLGGVTDVGAFEGELKIPVGQGMLVNVTAAGGTTYVAEVLYTDETGINVGSIDVNDVTLAGTLFSGGSFGPVSPVSVSTSGSGTSVTAFYTFTAPGGVWDPFDNGNYTVTLKANQVFDTDVPTPNAALPGNLGSFSVLIAANFVVDELGDVDDGDFGPGKLSLREAMKLANASPGTLDTITFAPALNGQAVVLTGELTVTDPVVIQGNGSFQTSINGDQQGRLFAFNITGLGAESKFNDLTLSNGKVTGSGGAILLADDALTLTNVVISGNESSSTGGAIQMTGGTLKVVNSTLNNNTAGSSGGAIQTSTTAAVIQVTGSTISGNTGTTGGGIYLSSGTLTVANSTISNNTTTSSTGGGISFTSGNVTVTDSTVSNNFADTNGGGIRFSTGKLTITRSTVSGNTGVIGGGIYLSSGTLDMSYTTVSGNTATGTGTSGGGGISASSGTLTINNSTISGNSATGIGGAIRGSSSLTLNLNNSTVTRNTANGAGGGGLGFSATSATTQPTVNVSSSIIAQNINKLHPDLYTAATTVTLTTNVNDSLVGADSGLVLISGFNNQTGTVLTPLNAALAPLNNNGGPTLTHALSAFSPALNAGVNGLGLANDQRGAGFPRLVGPQTDIGAFEGIGAIPIPTASAPDVTTPGGTTHTITVEYSDDVGILTSSLGDDDIVVSNGFGTPIAAKFVGFTGSGQKITATYTITPPGGSWDAYDNGLYTISVNPGAVTDGTNAAIPGPAGSFRVSLIGNFVVDNVADENDGDYSPGDLSLREAIRLANGSLGLSDTIIFSNTLNGQTIKLSLGELAITDGVTITGLGSGNLTIDAGKLSRIFSINDGAVGGLVTMSGLRLINGQSVGDGGAINAEDESLTLTDMVITGNAATGSGADGGGINVQGDGSTFKLINSTVSNNASGTAGDADGGGINFEGAVNATIQNSTIANNTAFDDGGGLLFQKANPDAHTVLIEGSTISGNVSNATTGGGGGANFGGLFASLVIRNSTISGNTTNKDGGGLQFYAVVDPVLIQNTTIAFNTATGATSKGGGINQFTDATGTITLESTIVSDNTASTGPDIQSTVGTISAQSSALGSFSVTNFSDLGGNLIGQPLLLTPLASNGGPTQTIRPQALSPVINVGINPAGLTTDQRGAGFPRQIGAGVDIGAFELDPNTPTATVSLTDVTTAGGTSYSFTVTYADDVAIDVATLGTGDVTVSGPGGFFATPTFTGVDINTNGTPRVATYVFTPPGGAWDVLDNGTYTVALGVNEVKDAAGNAIPGGTLDSFDVALPVIVTVDSLIDEIDGDYSKGNLSLREAIDLSNKSPSSINVITFDASLFSGGAQTITLALGQLNVTAAVAINGPGANKLTVSGNSASRVFSINDGTTAKIEVAISGMTLANAQSSGTGEAGAGGAVYIENETVTFDRVEMRNNTSASYGGAIFANSGTTLAVLNSSLNNNSALGGDSTRGGGAIEIESNGGSSLVVRNSTLAFNKAGVNTTSSVGGAIVAYSGVPSVLIENTTITQNKAHQAGGVRVFSTASGNLVITSSIVSGNTGSTSQPNFQTGSTPTNITLSLVGDTVGLGAAAVLDGFTSANIGVDPLLDVLQNNGGPTSTMALKVGSPAIDQGSNPSGLTSDQRGSPFVRLSGAGVDIGAFEVQPAPTLPPTVTKVTVNNGANQRSIVTSFKVTFSEAVTFPSGVNAAFQLVRTGPGAPTGVINLSAVQSGSDVTITFLPGGAVGLDPGASLRDGVYELTIFSANVQGVGGNLDGDGNGTGGDNFVTPTTPGTPGRLHRLFGDNDGDADVDAQDYGAFRAAFGGVSNLNFDFDQDGDVDAQDFGQFRARFGLNI